MDDQSVWFRPGFRFALAVIATGLATALPTGCSPAGPRDPQATIERTGMQAGADAEPFEARVDRSHAGTPAPYDLFQDSAGEPASIPQFAGRPVLLNLWATWCAPCVVEMPALNALAAREKDIVVLAVSQDLYGQKKVETFFAERDFRELQPNIDPERMLMRRLGIDTLPTTILYDSNSREIWRIKGMADWQGSSAARLIAEAVMPAPESSRPLAQR